MQDKDEEEANKNEGNKRRFIFGQERTQILKSRKPEASLWHETAAENNTLRS